MRTPFRAWQLRHRLLVALLGLAAAGLAVFAVTGMLLLERSLVSRVDGQLTDMASLVGRRPSPPPPRDPGAVELPTPFNITFYAANGNLLGLLPNDAPDGPLVTADVLSKTPSGPMTVSGRTGSADWRVRVVPLQGGTRAVVAMSLESTQSTVHQLLIIEVAAGTLILALLGSVALVVVRLGLRPLTRMEGTAEAIASGEIERRVTDTDPRTEIGRLGGTFNIMVERLSQALGERERSEQRLRHFVADASHELRTPLTSIRGFADLYHQGKADRDPAAEALLQRIEIEAARMGILVEDLLLLARLDHERTLEISTVDLQVLAGDVVHAAHARDRDRPIRLELSAEPICVEGDELRLHQVIANLVGNAITHTRPGTPVSVNVGRVLAPPRPETVHAGSGPAPGIEAALIEVHDAGTGIAPEHLPHVFDRFYRADPARSRGNGGTGLGLAIAAALVQAHGGRIEACSSAHGTTFRVLLPFTLS